MEDIVLRFIPFTSDYGFKATFGNEKNPIFLKKALQALIDSPIPIIDVRFDKNTFEGITKDGRSGIYDVSCTDEQGNHFIVEMQVGEAPHFMLRVKFYGFHKFNTQVKKGDFDYANMKKIYCIAILATSIFDNNTDYHNVGVVRNAKGYVMDDQMVYVAVELDKFDKLETDCQTDLDKLIFTMKNLQNITEPTQFPKFWTEEWLKFAIRELDTRQMTPEERFVYEKTLAQNAEAVWAEKRRINAIIEQTNAEKAALVEQKDAEKAALVEQKDAEKAALVEQKDAEKAALVEQKDAEKAAAAIHLLKKDMPVEEVAEILQMPVALVTILKVKLHA